jgi:hypothetical protein
MRVMITIETGPFPDLPQWPNGLTREQVLRLIARIDEVVQDEEWLKTAIQLRARDLDADKEIDI